MDFNASVLVLAHPTPECSVCAGKSYSKPWLYANGTLGVREVNAPFTPQSDSCQLNLCRHDLSSMTFSKKKRNTQQCASPPCPRVTQKLEEDIMNLVQLQRNRVLSFSFFLFTCRVLKGWGSENQFAWQTDKRIHLKNKMPLSDTTTY